MKDGMKALNGNKKDEWGTPFCLINKLDKEFSFSFDPCGDLNRPIKENIRTNDIRVTNLDGLDIDWSGSVFVNPPYSRGNLKKWCLKCVKESKNCDTIVLLIPSYTDTKYFHKMLKCLNLYEIRFIKGRISFWDYEKEKYISGNPLPSVLYIFHKHRPNDFNFGEKRISSFEWKNKEGKNKEGKRGENR